MNADTLTADMPRRTVSVSNDFVQIIKFSMGVAMVTADIVFVEIVWVVC